MAPDELTVIKGMGPLLAEWFRTSLGVRTFGDLAALSQQRIDALAKQQRRRFPTTRIRNILAQARKLARATAAQPKKREASMVDRRRGGPESKSSGSDWQDRKSVVRERV